MRTLKHKELIIYLALILGIINESTCQNWFAGNPVWTYDYDAWYCDFSIGEEEMRFEKDTVIDNLIMKKMIVTLTTNTMGTIDTFVGNKFYYEIDDVVYMYNGGSHRELYNFSIDIGHIDTIDWHNDFYCDSLLFLRLDTIEEMIIGNENLKVQKWSRVTDSITYPEYYIVLEKIGALGNLPFDAKLHWNCHIHSCYPYELTCYVNDSLTLNYPEQSNCFVSIADKAIEKEELIAYPNPVQNNINIRTKNQLLNVNIYDTSGHLVLTKTSDEIFNVENLIPGFYYLMINYQDQEPDFITFIKN